MTLPICLLFYAFINVVHSFYDETTLSYLPEDVYLRLEIVPKLIEKAPEEWCDVEFPSGTKFDKGGMVAAKTIRRRPTISWKGDPDALYVVFMYGVNKFINKIIIYPDLIMNDYYLHWIVVNVPGTQLRCVDNQITAGTEWFPFLKPLIPPLTCTHRYVVLVFKQNHTLHVDNATATFGGEWFETFPSLKQFAFNESLGEPVCGNLCVIRT